MTQIDIKTLMDEINSKNNKEFIIEFEGIITDKIKMENNANINCEEWANAKLP